MTRYVYSVWLKDQTEVPTEQDFEWVACFFIESVTLEETQSWGDHLAKSYTSRNPETCFSGQKSEGRMIPLGSV